MFSFEHELACDGVPPTGPVSAWPWARNERLQALARAASTGELEGDEGMEEMIDAGIATPFVSKPTAGSMAKGLFRTGAQALRRGRVSSEIREERYDTCKACPFFNKESKRCNDCGCFMEAKTWVGGNPDNLCPQQKWSR